MQHTSDQSLASFLADANRAQALLGQLDLSLILEHDQSEISQMQQVITVLEEVETKHQTASSRIHFKQQTVPQTKSSGPKSFDFDQTPTSENAHSKSGKADTLAEPDSTNEASNSLEIIQNAGFSNRIGRVYFSGSSDPLKPLNYVPHRDGLPRFEICIAPKSAPIEGAHGIFISNCGVFCAAVPEPIADTPWRIIRSMPYESKAEMLDLVQRFIDKS